jgi:hypothetical protein
MMLRIGRMEVVRKESSEELSVLLVFRGHSQNGRLHHEHSARKEVSQIHVKRVNAGSLLKQSWAIPLRISGGSL